MQEGGGGGGGPMHGEVLVKHLQRPKNAISELPFQFLPPMNQIITKQTLCGIMTA